MENNLFLSNIRQQFEKLLPYLPGTGDLALRHLRHQALEKASHVGIPHHRLETWKHADLQSLFEVDYKPYLHLTDVTLPEIEFYLTPHIKCSKLVFINGYYAPHLSHKLQELHDVTITHLHHLAKTQPSLLAELIEDSMQEPSFFHQLNSAFTTDGPFIIIPENYKAAFPIIIYYFILDNQQPSMVNSQTHIYVEKNAGATIIEKTISLTKNPILINTQHFIKAHPQSELHFHKMTMNSPSDCHFEHVHASLLSSTLHFSMYATGSSYHRIETNMLLHDKKANIDFCGMMIPFAKSHIDWVSQVVHMAPLCQSEQIMQSFICDHGHSSFLGKISVNENAYKTDARLKSLHILLGSQGKADSAPQFEIHNDDVQCTHGATISGLDENALFYLQSRGCSLSQSKSLIIHALMDKILSKIENIPIRTNFYYFINECLYDL